MPEKSEIVAALREITRGMSWSERRAAALAAEVLTGYPQSQILRWIEPEKDAPKEIDIEVCGPQGLLS